MEISRRFRIVFYIFVFVRRKKNPFDSICRCTYIYAQIRFIGIIKIRERTLVLVKLAYTEKKPKMFNVGFQREKIELNRP